MDSVGDGNGHGPSYSVYHQICQTGQSITIQSVCVCKGYQNEEDRQGLGWQILEWQCCNHQVVPLFFSCSSPPPHCPPLLNPPRVVPAFEDFANVVRVEEIRK